jgi:polysaccharide lyase-like protein
LNRFILMTTILLPALSAVAQTNADVIWTGDFEAGQSSFSGSCNPGQNQWCNDQIVRPAQMQAVTSPVVQGKYAARFEAKFGDKYRTYSDSRALMTGPLSLWEDEGNERWYRWQSMWPTDWVGRFPKWDELSNPGASSHGGSVVEWHHDANGAVETGSAPIYIGADDKFIWLCIVDQATSACREYFNLAPLVRGHWHDIVMHAKWSSSASVGFLEIWVDGVLVLPMHFGSNKYPGMRNYLVVGLYRNGEIGDPNLLYPNGTHVYGTDGTPGVVYLDGFIVGKTKASVLGEVLLTDAPPPAPPVADAGTPAPLPPPDPAPPVVSDPGDAGVVATNPTNPVTATPPASTTSPARSPNVAAASLGSGGCSSGGLPVVWTSLIAFAILMMKVRRRREQVAVSSRKTGAGQ